MESWHTVSWPLPVASRATNGNAPPATALSDPDRNSWKTSAVFPSKMAIAGSKCANFPQVVPSGIPRMLVTSHQIFPRFRVNSPFVHDFHQDCHWRFSILRQTQTWFKRKSTPILWNHFNKKTKKNGPTKKWFNQPVCWLYHVISPSLCREMLGFPHLF